MSRIKDITELKTIKNKHMENLKKEGRTILKRPKEALYADNRSAFIEAKNVEQAKSSKQNTDKTVNKPIRIKKENRIWVYQSMVATIVIAALLIIWGCNGKSVAWDEVAATKIVMKELDKHSWSDFFNDASKINHKIIGFENVSGGNKNLIVAITLSYDGNSEPLGIPSVFEFRNKNGWKIYRQQIGFGEFMEHIKLNMYTNYGGYCLITSRNEAGAGRSWDNSVVYAFTDTRSGFQEIFNTVNDFKFIPNEPTWDIEEIPENGNPETYIFMGSKFVKKSEIFSK